MEQIVMKWSGDPILRIRLEVGEGSEGTIETPKVDFSYGAVYSNYW